MENSKNNPVMGRNSCELKLEYEKSLDFGPKLKQQLWVCGLYTGTYGSWEIVGVFSTKQKAIDACENEYYFVGPIILDEDVNQKSQPWPGAYYPKQKKH